MDKKKCRYCNQVKPLNEFYKNKQMVDGLTNKCKDCSSDYSLNRYYKKHPVRTKRPGPKSREERNKARRERRRKLKLMGYKRSDKYKPHYTSEYRQKYPEKRKAYAVSTYRIKLDFEGAHRHHWSYNDEHHLDVIQLSQTHHNKAHRFLIYDQERKMYRNLSGELLDTRERHESYIRKMIETMED